MRLTGILLLLSILLNAVPTAEALPKFASRLGVSCQSCHVNPTGKGMRNEFGRTYGMDDLTMERWKERSDLEEISLSLTPNIDVGIDVRTLFFAEQQSGQSSTLQMQGDIYFDIRLNKWVRLYLDKGLYNGFEAFALAKGLPWDGYVKAGKFMPAYGTRTDDHNAFIRGGPYGGGPFSGQFQPLSAAGYLTGLRFGERSEDTGLELGASPGVFTFNVGVFNGSPGSGLNGVTPTSDKAIAGRGDARFKFSIVNASIGGSVYQAKVAGNTHLYRGVFGSVTVAERYTLNSEVDLTEIDRPGPNLSGLMAWNELNVVVTTGIDVKLGYEFYDPDRNLKNGSFSRILVGAEFFVLSGVELRPMYRINIEEPNDVPNNELQLMLHLFL